MSDLKAVAYVSRAAQPMRARDLETLLIEARSFNEPLQVTGALLHHDGRFFQYLEGSPPSVERVYDRVRRSHKHEALVELLNQPIAGRQFARWHMAFTEAPLNTLQTLTNEIWAMKLPALNQQQMPSPGLLHLLTFWQAARSGEALR
jgi:hypothetical protein